jgi:hypothetical protein
MAPLHRFLRGKNPVTPQSYNFLAAIIRLPRVHPNLIALQGYSKGQTRSMGSVSAIDSAIFRTLFGTEEIRQVGTKEKT